jgi:hypothetical protein
MDAAAYAARVAHLLDPDDVEEGEEEEAAAEEEGEGGAAGPPPGGPGAEPGLWEGSTGEEWLFPPDASAAAGCAAFQGVSKFFF